jgi:hypothetical protein
MESKFCCMHENFEFLLRNIKQINLGFFLNKKLEVSKKGMTWSLKINLGFSLNKNLRFKKKA